MAALGCTDRVGMVALWFNVGLAKRAFSPSGTALPDNPLLYSVLALFSAAIAIRIIWARRLCISLTSTERSAAWVVAGALFFANWAYVIFYVG